MRDLLLDTSYGTTLIVKVSLVAVLIGLGALNRRRSIPRLTTDGRLLSRVLTVEAAGAVIVLAATALLTGLNPEPPAAPSRPDPASISATGADFATTLRVRLTAAPGTPGPNDFDVRVMDYDSGEDAVATGVSLTFEPVGRPGINSSQLELRQNGVGRVGRRGHAALAGRSVERDDTGRDRRSRRRGAHDARDVRAGRPTGERDRPRTTFPRS